jgi:RNA polymerase sigma factor (sigma-70 family)
MKISGPAWREATLVDCVAAAGTGDQRAFAELFERYRQYAWGVARSVTRSHQAAEDATVDGFAAAFRSIHRLREPARFPSYLAACVRNEALQEVRRRSPNTAAGEFDDIEQHAPVEADTPESRLVNSEEGRRALQALQRLDDRQRDAILLVDVEGVAPSEAAASLGLTVNALHQLLHRAREALRHRYVAPAISETSPTACLSCNDKLGIYLAGRASVRVISMVDDHTSTCPDCQARLADARETNDCVRAAYGIAPVGLVALLAGRHGFGGVLTSGRRVRKGPHRHHGGSGRGTRRGPRAGGPPSAGQGRRTGTAPAGSTSGADDSVGVGTSSQAGGLAQSLRQIAELPQRVIGMIPHALSWAQLSAFPMGTALAFASGSMTTFVAMAATVPLQIGGPAVAPITAAAAPSTLATPLVSPGTGSLPAVGNPDTLAGTDGTTTTTAPAGGSTTTTPTGGDAGAAGNPSGGGGSGGTRAGASSAIQPSFVSPGSGGTSGGSGGPSSTGAGGTGAATGTTGTTTTTTAPPGVAPSFSPGGTATFYIGSVNTFEVHASGSPIPTLSVSGALPAGVTFADQHDGTGVFTGSPGHSTQGVFPVVVSATNSVGPPVTLPVQLTVAVAGPLEITSSPVAFCQLGRQCTIHLTATGTPTPTLTVSGTLPPGLTFSPGVGGTATLGGVAGGATRWGYPVTVTASNGAQPSVSRQLWIVVWSHDQ